MIAFCRDSFKRLALAALALTAAVAGCTAANDGGAGEVVIYTSVDQVYAEPLFREFERETGIRVVAVFDTEETKSTGVLNRLIAEGDNPRADLFWSGDPVRPFLLIGRGLSAPYVPANAAAIPATFRDAEGSWTGTAARARVLLVNRERLAGRPMPTRLDDLADPRWKGNVAIANPLFGTTTMHAAALFATRGEAEARRFFEALKANDVRVAGSNGEVRRLVVSGEVAFGLTDTDDAYEAVKDGAPVEIVYPDQDGAGALVMPTSVILIRGGPNPGTARQLADFLVSPEAERMMAASAAHMPLHSGVATPANVGRIENIRAMEVDYGEVASTMERIQPWLREWVGLSSGGQ